MFSDRRSPTPLDARAPRVVPAWLGASLGALLVASLAGCFDSKRIIFESSEADAAAADVSVGGLAPADDGVAAAEAAPTPNDPHSAQAAPRSARNDPRNAAPIDAGP